MKPTREQTYAIQTQDRALVVEAGAGTGKTWVLVQRFMRLLQDHPDWPMESIVAVTFTEKAAREMRTRLRKAIEERAAEKLPEAERRPAAERLPEAERLPAAEPNQAVWQERRLSLDRMRVSTIHSLCSRILRENAIACGVDPHFQVLDEQEADLLKEEAVRAALQVMDGEDHPALALLASLRLFDLRNEMERMLGKRGILHKLFQDLGSAEGLLSRWEEGIREMREAVWAAQLRNHPELEDILEWIPTVVIADPEDKLAGSVSLAQGGCRDYAQGDMVGASKDWLGINLRGGRKDNWGGAEALVDLRAALKTLREAAKTLEAAGALLEIGEMDQEAAGHLQLWRSLWDTLDSAYTAIKDRQQALDFDDLEILTERLLHGRPHGGRLRGFLEGINHLMVDEFQDTNPVQQRIVYALAPPDQGGKLFVVGDAKQSIYRFRQAQVSIFNQTAKEVEIVTGRPTAALSTSFRSHHSLVQAVNELFEVILAPHGGEQAAYEAVPGPLTASRGAHPDLPTPVEMLLLPVKEPGGEGKLNMEEARIWEAGWIGQRLASLKEAKFPVWDKDNGSYRPFEYKDAAVLFRATTAVPLYEGAFKEIGLPYLTVSGRGYYDRPEVRDLISLLAALANPADDLNLAAALRSPLFSLSDETLYRLRWHQPGKGLVKEPIPFRNALKRPPTTDQVDRVERVKVILDMLWDDVNRVDLVQLLRKALDATAYETTLAISDEETGRQLSNVDKFMALARDRGGVNPSDFLRQLRDLQTREAREGEALGREPESGAVQLMSIHAAKGLEFPVVVLADLGRGKRAGFGSPYLLHDPAFGILCKVRDEAGDWVSPAGYNWGRWLHEAMEEAESKRLLYVACTRAADFLILCGRTGNRNTWMTDILGAWSIAAEGLEEEVQPYRDYAVQVYRPDAPPELIRVRTDAVPEIPFEISDVPPLVRQLPEALEWGPVSVTQLARSLKREASDPSDFRPAIWRSEVSKAGSVPGSLVGNIVHKVLALWEPLAFDDVTTLDLLKTLASDEGIDPEKIPEAVRRSRAILFRLREYPIYERVNRAEKRYHEFPFTFETRRGTVHGVIDLLYQDGSGEWHLVDWKTDWTAGDEVEKVASEYLVQMACYATAVERMLGVKPQVRMWFLHPNVREYRFSEEELDIIAQGHGLCAT